MTGEEALERLARLLPRAARLTDVPQGLSGTPCATVQDTAGRAVAHLKWAESRTGAHAALIRREAANLAAIPPGTKVAPMLAFDSEAPLLATRHVPRSPGAGWTTSTWTAATQVLRDLRRTRPEGLPHLSEWEAFRDRGQETLQALNSAVQDRALARRLEHRYTRMREATEGTATCHSDAHPENWILTGHGPVLVDLARMAYGPEGFDETFLAAHISAPARKRVAWLAKAGVDLSTAATVSGAIAARTTVGRTSDNREWAAWCEARWENTVDMASELDRHARDGK